MRIGRLAALLLTSAGLFLIVASLILSFAGSTSGAQFWAQLAVGVVLLIVGLVLAVLELIEAFLQRGSTALVDGLQAE